MKIELLPHQRLTLVRFLYFRKNVQIEIIAKILGHSVEVCRKTYVHFVEEQLKNAASEIEVMVEL